MKVGTAGGPAPALRRAGLTTATLFFASGCGLGGWLPHIPDVKISHGLSDGVLGRALPALAGGAVAALPVAGALTARYGSRPILRGGRPVLRRASAAARRGFSAAAHGLRSTRHRDWRPRRRDERPRGAGRGTLSAAHHVLVPQLAWAAWSAPCLRLAPWRWECRRSSTWGAVRGDLAPDRPAARPARAGDVTGAQRNDGWSPGEGCAPKGDTRHPRRPTRSGGDRGPSPREPHSSGGGAGQQRIAGVKYLTGRAAAPGRHCLGEPHQPKGHPPGCESSGGRSDP